MAAELVLVVDDDPGVAAVVERALRLDGFRTEIAPDGRAVLDAVRRLVPDIVVLDLGLPDMDGVDVCARLRGTGDDVAVLVLTARGEVADRVGGLESGADDYLVKPFAVEELLARVKALLRRRAPSSDGPLRYADLMLDPASRVVSRGDQAIDLTRREFELLEVFLRNPGIVLDRSRLMERVWGGDFEVEANTVDTYVGYLRRKLEADGKPRLLQTVRGVGFVLRDG